MAPVRTARRRPAGAAFAVGVSLVAGALLESLDPAPAVVARTPVTAPPVASPPVPPPPTGTPLPATTDLSPAAVPVPTRLRIPGLGVDAPVVPTGVDDGGALAVPGDGATVGWWAGGPGLDGPAVLAGHVDTPSGPGALFALARIGPGDLVAVEAAGAWRNYAVRTVRSVPKARLPATGVFDGAGAPGLAILTCTGPYDERTGYRDNLVVVAEPR